MNICVRSSTGRQEIGGGGRGRGGGGDADAFGCDDAGTVAVGGEWDDDKGHCSIITGE